LIIWKIFSGNGYDIVDKTFTPNEITFDNIWGVCDEDMYNKAIGVMNKEAKENKPFFNHIMTVVIIDRLMINNRHAVMLNHVKVV
jgi:phosphoglycerol transferase MdoB-like AlkP superfamily enzyme